MSEEQIGDLVKITQGYSEAINNSDTEKKSFITMKCFINISFPAVETRL